MAATMSGRVAAMPVPRGWGTRSVLAAKKCLEANGRDDGVFISLSPFLATSVAECNCLLGGGGNR